jgi:hypothetical protein
MLLTDMSTKHFYSIVCFMNLLFLYQFPFFCIKKSILPQILSALKFNIADASNYVIFYSFIVLLLCSPYQFQNYVRELNRQCKDFG